MTKLRNVFDIPQLTSDKEFTEVMTQGDVIIERIISIGQTTPVDEWYNQDKDEWVVLLEGEARLFFEQTGEIIMNKGDYILIKAHERHRVEYTSLNPPCVWLAIHGNFKLST